MEPAPAPASPAESRDALRALYEEHGPRVLRFLVRLLGERAAAEDALQETFLRVRVEALDPQRSPRPFLLKVARNVGIAALRKRAIRAQALTQPLASQRPPEDPQHASLRGEVRDQVQAALASLPPGLRAALLLRHDQGLSMRALGDALGVSDRTARVRLREATVYLARALREQGYLAGGEA